MVNGHESPCNNCGGISFDRYPNRYFTMPEFDTESGTPMDQGLLFSVLRCETCSHVRLLLAEPGDIS